MNSRLAITWIFLIAVLLVVAWFAERVSRLPLTWQTVLAVGASLLVVILAAVIWRMVRRERR